MTLLRRGAAVWLVLGALLAGAFFVAAADQPLKKDYALIFGTVYAADGRPAPGVRVKIRRADHKKPKWELYSDRHGEFALRVAKGKADYVVWAERKGRKGPQAETTVHVENDERVDLGLHLTE